MTGPRHYHLLTTNILITRMKTRGIFILFCTENLEIKPVDHQLKVVVAHLYDTICNTHRQEGCKIIQSHDVNRRYIKLAPT